MPQYQDSYHTSLEYGRNRVGTMLHTIIGAIALVGCLIAPALNHEVSYTSIRAPTVLSLCYFGLFLVLFLTTRKPANYVSPWRGSS